MTESVARNPTRVLQRIIGDSVTIGDLVEDPVAALDPSMDVKAAAHSMAARSFDYCVVAGDPVSRYVALEDLQASSGVVADCAQNILATDCAERSTPLSGLFDLLGHREFIFVLERDSVRYIVSRADLGAPAVSMVVLAYVLAFERAIQHLFRLHQIDPLESLGQARRAAAEHIFEERRRSRTEVSLEDCLQFADWLDACAKIPCIREPLGFQSQRQVSKCKRWLQEHRNNLAHGGSVLDTGDPEVAIGEAVDLIDLAARAWSEVERISGPWAAFVSSVITQGDLVLAGPGAIDWPYSGAVAIVTAWNPAGVQRPLEINRAANAELRDYLAGKGLEPVEVTGSSPDGSWREDSFLVACEGSALTHIGHLFGQLAVFEVDETTVRVVRCSDGLVMEETDRVRIDD